MKYLKYLTTCYLALFLVACATTTTSTHMPNRTAAGYNVQLGMGYLQQGEIQRAKSKLLLALEQAPDWPAALDAMAYFQESTGNIDTARQYYQRSVALAPQDGNVLNNYGAFLCRTGQYQQAETYFLKAVRDPNYLTTALAYENAGLCALKQSDKSQAIVHFQKALSEDPKRVPSLIELAKLPKTRAQSHTLIQAIDRYLRLVIPPEPEVLHLGIQVAEQVGDNQAATHYRQLLAKH